LLQGGVALWLHWCVGVDSISIGMEVTAVVPAASATIVLWWAWVGVAVQ